MGRFQVFFEVPGGGDQQFVISAHSLYGTSHHRVCGASSLFRKDEMREITHFEKL